MKWLVFILPLLTALASVVPCAGAQSGPLQTSDDPVGDVVETTGDALGHVSQPSSLSDPTDALSDTTSATEQTAADAVDSSRKRADDLASPGEAFRTRFDRLPPRLERLLERIELGRNVRANLRRLEQALASVSARERARLLRRLNAEIRRLRANGVSPAERRRIDRLIRTRAMITALSVPTPVSAVADATAGTSPTALAPGAGAAHVAAGVLRAFVAGSEATPKQFATPPREGAVGPSGPSGVPDDGAGGAFPLAQVLLALCALLLVITGGLAIKEDRAL
jgi:hypothetical protein